MNTYTSWSSCDECGFHGLMEFKTREDENYDDQDSLGVMMDCVCPSCGASECVLLVIEQYEEMVFMSRNVQTAKRSRD